MKKLVLWSVLIVVSQGMFAQTVAEIQKMLSDENISGARKMARELIKKEPTNGDGYYYLGETFYFDEAQDSAAFWYNKGLALAPEASAPHVGVGKIALDKGLAQDAEKSFGRALRSVKKKPAEAYALIGIAYLNSQKPDTEKALSNFTLARDSDTKNPRYFMLLGDAQMASEKIGDALTNYQFAAEKDKENPEIQMKIALTYIRNGIKDVGQKNLEDIIAKFPSYPPAYKALYEVYFDNKQYTKGTPILSKYVDLAGSDIDARVRLVRYLVGIVNDFDRGITEAQTVLQQDPNRSEVYRYLAWAYVQKEKYKEALESSKLFFEKEPARKKFAIDYENYAKAAAKLKEFDLAAENYMKVLELDTTKVEVYDMIAKMYYTDAKNYPVAGKAYYTKISKVKATNQDWWFIGNCEYQQKNYSLADTAFRKVNEIVPDYGPGWLMRAKTNKQLDTAKTKPTLAKPYYEKFLSLTEPKIDTDFKKRSAIEAYNYLAEHFANALNDYPAAVTFFDKIIALDPANKEAPENKKLLEEAIKTSGGGNKQNR
jgi:tetratricopeptide (TPR) repeat protein